MSDIGIGVGVVCFGTLCWLYDVDGLQRRLGVADVGAELADAPVHATLHAKVDGEREARGLRLTGHHDHTGEERIVRLRLRPFLLGLLQVARWHASRFNFLDCGATGRCSISVADVGPRACQYVEAARLAIVLYIVVCTMSYR